MPTQSKKKLSNVLISPLKDVLIEVARGVANAQMSLDQQALELSKEIYSNKELEDFRNAGIEPTWYQIPEVTASLKLTVSLHSEGKEEGEKVNENKAINRFEKLRVIPYNAVYQNSFDYDCKGASEITFKIVPIPPPTDATYTIVPNLIGSQLNEALKLIGESRIIVGEVIQKESEKSSGLVIDQSLEALSRVSIGEKIDITISKK